MLVLVLVAVEFSVGVVLEPVSNKVEFVLVELVFFSSLSSVVVAFDEMLSVDVPAVSSSA